MLLKTQVAHWIVSYSSCTEMESSHSQKADDYIKSLNLKDAQERINMSWYIIHRVRKSTSKGKQLHKY